MGDNKKICPLMTRSGNTIFPCQEEKCGWWNNMAGDCAVNAISVEITRLRIAVQEQK